MRVELFVLPRGIFLSHRGEGYSTGAETISLRLAPSHAKHISSGHPICPHYALLLKLDHVKREVVAPRFFELSGAAVEAFQSN